MYLVNNRNLKRNSLRIFYTVTNDTPTDKNLGTFWKNLLEKTLEIQKKFLELFQGWKAFFSQQIFPKLLRFLSVGTLCDKDRSDNLNYGRFLLLFLSNLRWKSNILQKAIQTVRLTWKWFRWIKIAIDKNSWINC